MIRERRVCITVAVALVLLRTAGPTLWETAFNSDQAVVGLMAKHLSELRAFPLFFYGQNYMLGVQSWIAVPFFWLGGPTVAMLRLPLVLLNCAVVAALLVMFTRLGMRPVYALVGVLPLVTTTPAVSEALVEAIGASVEPFAYVLLLWGLRRRPAVFGAVFCVAFLHREFVLFAAPALAVAQWRERRWWTPRQAARAAVGFFAVWVAVDLLKRSINAYGPSGGMHASSSLLLQSQQILMWLSAAPGPYLERLQQAVGRGVPDLLGARSHLLSYYGIAGGITVGSWAAGAALAAAACMAAFRLSAVAVRRNVPDRSEAFTLYLAVVGALTLLAYGLNSGIDPAAAPIVRYLLFVLFLPVALLGAFFLREPVPRVRAVVALLVCAWGLMTAADNIRLLRQHRLSPPANPHREIADYLVQHRIRFGRAGYWDAYVVTFLSKERVLLASTEKVRISAYQARVDANSSNAVYLRRQPCTSGVAIAAWCVEDPLHGRKR